MYKQYSISSHLLNILYHSFELSTIRHWLHTPYCSPEAWSGLFMDRWKWLSSSLVMAGYRKALLLSMRLEVFSQDIHGDTSMVALEGQRRLKID